MLYLSFYGAIKPSNDLIMIFDGVIKLKKVNIIDGIASEYGIHRFGWYVTQGLFVTCGAAYPLGIYGFYKCYKIHKLARIMMTSLILNLFFLELGPHKEFRFIQNAIPGNFTIR